MSTKDGEFGVLSVLWNKLSVMIAENGDQSLIHFEGEHSAFEGNTNQFVLNGHRGNNAHPILGNQDNNPLVVLIANPGSTPNDPH